MTSTKKIRILYVIDHFEGRWGGTEGQLYSLIEKIDKSLFEVELCLFRRVNDYFERNPFPCRFFYLGIRTFASPHSYISLCKLRTYIKQEKIDIVQTLFNEAAIVVPFLACGAGARVVSSRRDMGYWYTRRNLFLLRKGARYVTKYLVNSYAVKENLMNKEGVRENKIETIYNGLDLNKYGEGSAFPLRERFGIPNDAFVVGILANSRPVKRIPDLIKAFSYLLSEFSNSYLIIVGDTGDLLADYKQLVSSLGLGDRVIFTGLAKDPYHLIKHFSVGVNCSESEGFSNAILEYMASGIPVVATATSGNREIVVDGENGYLAPVGDAPALAEKLCQMLRDASQRERLVQKAKEFVRRNFAEERIIKNYQSFYQGVV